MELQIIKLAKYYNENPEKGDEVFEKLAVGVLANLGAKAVGWGRSLLGKAKAWIGQKGGAPGLAQKAKELPGKAARAYGNAWKTSPGTTGLNTLMAADMVKGGSEKLSTFDFIQARENVLSHTGDYHQAESDEEKSFHKKAALEALMIMGQ